MSGGAGFGEMGKIRLGLCWVPAAECALDSCVRGGRRAAPFQLSSSNPIRTHILAGKSQLRLDLAGQAVCRENLQKEAGQSQGREVLGPSHGQLCVCGCALGPAPASSGGEPV